ncbi:hypothetical protein Bpfe_020098 [Biomphalaria pfeifferi]|uniref:Uncharacterized protein n=1 Tax=Biomphalaria pfeifferi TaxID=112525 RepID=A0AAD8F3X5_BIOPF|nr:hypothetical protein Bpfe_020098 [Biomphalaria pfeifferi]
MKGKGWGLCRGALCTCESSANKMTDRNDIRNMDAIVSTRLGERWGWMPARLLRSWGEEGIEMKRGRWLGTP